MKNANEGEKLRAEVQRLDRGTRRRFPEELKERLVRYTRARRAAGESYVAIGRMLGVRWPTVADWAKPRAPKGKAFRAVEVRESQSSSTIVVYGSGLRVEGLDISGVAELLRRLS